MKCSDQIILDLRLPGSALRHIMIPISLATYTIHYISTQHHQIGHGTHNINPLIRSTWKRFTSIPMLEVAIGSLTSQSLVSAKVLQPSNGGDLIQPRLARTSIALLRN